MVKFNPMQFKESVNVVLTAILVVAGVLSDRKDEITQENDDKCEGRKVKIVVDGGSKSFEFTGVLTKAGRRYIEINDTERGMTKVQVGKVLFVSLLEDKK